MHVADPVNILLVDDQPAKLLTYEAMLDQLGANLIKASSGREALEHLLKQEITLVLMDVSMPDLDGFELAEIIREHPRFRKTAIIFVSAVHLTDMDRLKGSAKLRPDSKLVVSRDWPSGEARLNGALQISRGLMRVLAAGEPKKALEPA